jgi:hypothetical protein
MRRITNLFASFLLVLTSCQAWSESISFEIFALEGTEKRLLASGEKQYSVNDTLVSGSAGLGQSFMSKELALGNGFSVGLSDHGGLKQDGIGFWLRRNPSPMETDKYEGFSWEWFNRSNGSVFKKLQGKGEIRVATQRVGNNEFIVRVEFLDDMVFRMNAKRHGKPGEETHHMTIKKGSVLVFPALNKSA